VFLDINMRWNLIAPVLSISLLCAPAVKAEDAACTPSRKTIVDYFFTLPDRYIADWSFEERQKQRSGPEVRVDVKNGYMQFSGGAESRTTLALFRKPDGTAMIASNYSGIHFPPNGEPDNISELTFLTCKAGRLFNVTQEVLPVEVNKDLEYELPRIGTTIVVSQFQKGRLYSLVWKKGRFVRQP
jgi:hypothetical protein